MEQPDTLRYEPESRFCPIPPAERDLPTAVARPWLKVSQEEPNDLEGVSFDRQGNLWFVEAAASRLHRVDMQTGEDRVVCTDPLRRGMSATKHHRDGRVFIPSVGPDFRHGYVFAVNPDGSDLTVLREGPVFDDLTFDRNGGYYYTHFVGSVSDPCGEVAYVSPQGTVTPVLRHRPTMPLTLLEKRWLKAIAEDPRVKLFGAAFPALDDVRPLFTKEDYRIYDQYADGDPFEDETYIRHFRLILSAIRENRPVRITMTNRRGKEVWMRFRPKGFEYSVKDDKIRIIATGCRFRQFNLARINSCKYYGGGGPWREKPPEERKQDLTLLIKDERNALERVMLHFAHFEKRAERLEGDRYCLHLKYYESDETEMVIRVLSFGPCVKVLAPSGFVDLIKERLVLQKSCELR